MLKYTKPLYKNFSRILSLYYADSGFLTPAVFFFYNTSVHKSMKQMIYRLVNIFITHKDVFPVSSNKLFPKH